MDKWICTKHGEYTPPLNTSGACPYCLSLGGSVGYSTAIASYQASTLIDNNKILNKIMPIRKEKPLFSGCISYFPDALLAIAEHSKKANDKHNPGQPLHWSKHKSADHADCVARHLLDIGQTWNAVDPEFNSYHATALAWRALALLQTVIEREKENKNDGQ